MLSCESVLLLSLLVLFISSITTSSKSRLALMGNFSNECSTLQPSNISPFDKKIHYTQSCHITEFHYYWKNNKGTKVMGGPNYNLFKLFKEVTGIKLECLTPEPYIYGAKKNGIYNGELGLLQNGSADISANKLFHKYDINQFASFTVPVTEAPWCIIVRKYGPIPFYNVLLLPYKKKVWFSAAGALVVTVIAWHFTNTAFHRRPKQSHILSITDCLFNVLQVGLTGACNRSPRVIQQRCVFGALLLFILVISNGYQGKLLGFLTAPPSLEEPHTLEEASVILRHLYAQGKFDFFFGGKNPSNPTLRKLQNKLEIIKISEIQKKIESIMHGADDGVLLTHEKFYLFSHSPQFIRNGETTIRYISECFNSPGHLSFLVRKDSPLRDIFTMFVMYVMEGGLFDHWVLAYRHIMVANGVMMSDAASDKVKHPISLNLHHVEGAFFLLAAGLSLSLMTFLLEILQRSCKCIRSLGL